MILINASRNNLADRLRVEPQEERHRVPRRCLTIVHAMDCGLEPVVREPAEKISGVDDQSAFDGRRVKPLSIHRKDLQAAGHVLPQECQALDTKSAIREQAQKWHTHLYIGVSANTDVGIVLLVLLRARIMDEDRVCAWVCGDGVEVVFG
jgi:hypothetical protein